MSKSTRGVDYPDLSRHGSPERRQQPSPVSHDDPDDQGASLLDSQQRPTFPTGSRLFTTNSSVLSEADIVNIARIIDSRLNKFEESKAASKAANKAAAKKTRRKDPPDYGSSSSSSGNSSDKSQSAEAEEEQEDDTDTEVKPRSWKVEDIGLFDPSLSSAEHGDDDIVKVGKDTFFRDVSLFLESANEAVLINSAKTVRRHLHVCLRGDA